MKIKAEFEESLVRLFGSTSRARILALLYANIGKSFYQREVMFETGLSLQATQRELNNLVTLGILNKKETYNSVYYEINPDSPYFLPLRTIFTLSPRHPTS